MMSLSQHYQRLHDTASTESKPVLSPKTHQWCMIHIKTAVLIVFYVNSHTWVGQACDGMRSHIYFLHCTDPGRRFRKPQFTNRMSSSGVLLPSQQMSRKLLFRYSKCPDLYKPQSQHQEKKPSEITNRLLTPVQHSIFTSLT